MNLPAARHARPRARTLALGLGVAIALPVAATARRVHVNELCGGCGARRGTQEVLGVPVNRTVEPRGWLGSLTGPDHRHGFVRELTTTEGWLGIGVPC